MDKLHRLEKKRSKRVAQKKQASVVRERQLAKYKKNGKKGHKVLAAQKGREMRADQKAINKLDRKIAAEKKRLAELKKKVPSGSGSWDGTKSIIQNEVMPIARQWGISPTSAKRWETYGNPGSDHWMGNRNAFAKDFATDSNGAFGAAIARELGIGYSGLSDDYKSYYIVRGGKNFRVQIIAGTHGTGPHLHIGIRRA